MNHRAQVWTRLFKYNDTQMGMLSIIAGMAPWYPSLDAAQTNSALHLQVFKMPLDTKRTKLFPPANFKISSLNLDYSYGQPAPGSPTGLPNPSRFDSMMLTVTTWQVVCDISTTKGPNPSDV